MLVSKLKQLQHEGETWKRLLSFMQEENAHQKNRVSKILVENINKKIIKDIAEFYSCFVSEDEQINLLQNEIEKVEKELKEEIRTKGELKKSIEKKINSLRCNISETEKAFGIIKMSFNKYLSVHIP